MFTNQTGKLCADAEAIAERIKAASDEEVEAAEERKAILRDVLNSFGMRLQDLPERERKATLSMLYKQMMDIIFDFHLSFETSATRANIASATTHTAKAEALHEFQLHVQDLAMIYGIE
jgi:hypothetical protein